MTRYAWQLIVVLGLAAGAGCGPDTYARRILEVNTDSGKLFVNLIGSGEMLEQQGRIDVHQRIRTADEVDIDVWVLRAKGKPDEPAPARGTVVVLHGTSESKAKFPYFGAAERLAKLGFDVVLADLRRHGRSGGKYVTYGALESRDIKVVMDTLVSGKVASLPVYAFGVTLGASTAIQYAAIDDRCKGVMAMAPFKDMAGIARGEILLMAPTMSKKDYEAVIARAGEIGGFDPADASAVKAAAQLKVPLLLVHGSLDLIVPVEHSKAIHEAAAGPKRLIIVKPGPEQLALLTKLEDWIAEKIDMLAETGLQDAPATPE